MACVGSAKPGHESKTLGFTRSPVKHVWFGQLSPTSLLLEPKRV